MIDRPLTPVEKAFLLYAERGDCTTVKRLIQDYKDKPDKLDINCVDPLSRSALIMAIENENIELVKLFLNAQIEVKDALLHAIKEEYVEAVELLLNWEEQHHILGQPYSWEGLNPNTSTFTPDVTPLILAAHKNNFEIIKILLGHGADLPSPHDVKCSCAACMELSRADSLRHSQARINAFRALISPSLIALTSKDAILTAFELSEELRRLSWMESEFGADYNTMKALAQNFASSLLDHARNSYELEVLLNYDASRADWQPGGRQTLERLRLAIKCRQKMFVAHPNVQQLLAAIWYDGVPGFRRRKILGQLLEIAKLVMMFPVYCTIHIIAPASRMGQFMKKPFVKFVCHSASYVFFLVFVSAASQRVDELILERFGLVDDWKKRERGVLFGLAECVVIVYVISLTWLEIKSLWRHGFLKHYVHELWNIIDFIANTFYIMWIALRISSWYIVRKEASRGENPWYPREQWHSFDPMLLSEAAFAAGMIFSFLKLTYIFSVSPHLGPLQISLGRMIIDIIKFFFIYTLVLFAFGCGLNQLLWYYAELERNKCYTANETPDFENSERACTIWRRYANLFETSQSLFWASFGLIDLTSFELTGIKGFTRFWALFMFGSYSVINVIVLLNMLIAMMSISYQMTFERADVEWKFARSRLWLRYFDDGDTLPPPFNILPTPKSLIRLACCGRSCRNDKTFQKESSGSAKERYEQVMHLIIRRYITMEQQKRDVCGVTEDDVREIRQDISTLRYELINILQKNGMRTPQVSEEDAQVSGKKDKIIERRILNDFYISTVKGAFKKTIGSVVPSKTFYGKIMKIIRRTTRKHRRQTWNTSIRSQTDNLASPTSPHQSESAAGATQQCSADQSDARGKAVEEDHRRDFRLRRGLGNTVYPSVSSHNLKACTDNVDVGLILTTRRNEWI